MPARYEVVAQTYGAGPDDYTVPATSELLALAEPIAGRRCLDLACGHGLIARELARRGASSVVGVDLSESLLRRARGLESAAPHGIDFFVADATDPDLLPERQFDVVTCNFGLSDIDDIPGLFTNVARLLDVGGCFVFSILHPCFPGVDGVSPSWPSGGYHDERWWRADGELSTLRQQVGANHRTLSTYFNALVASGLVVTRVLEPVSAEPPGYAQSMIGDVPLYLVVRATGAAIT